jgi:pimeloyl-ACP methyl ester carboxylesterase
MSSSRSTPTLRAVDTVPPVEPDELPIQYETIHGYRRAFVRAGSGPAILLLHGIGDNSDSWRQVLASLARNHTVVAPDLLGHGRSDKPRADYAVAAYANGMRDLLSVLGIDRATIVGHSLGGGVAAQFAYQYPDRCERLVLVGSGGVARDVTPLLRVAASPLADFFLPALHLPLSEVVGTVGVEVLRRLGTDLGQDADDLLRVFRALPDGASRRAFVRTLRSVVDWRGQVVTMLDRCYLARGMPTMLVWGARDAVIPVSHAYLAHAAMPGSRLEIFDDAGHFPHHADPERFLAVLGDFLATTEPATYRTRDWRSLLRRGRPESEEKAALRIEGALDLAAEPDRSGS